MPVFAQNLHRWFSSFSTYVWSRKSSGGEGCAAPLLLADLAKLCSPTYLFIKMDEPVHANRKIASFAGCNNSNPIYFHVTFEPIHSVNARATLSINFLLHMAALNARSVNRSLCKQIVSDAH